MEDGAMARRTDERVRKLARAIEAAVAGLLGALFALCVCVTPASADIAYLYDRLGRLIAVVDPASDTAIYSYDAVGNLLKIARQPSTAVSVIAFDPPSGPVGTTVTIQGTGFSTTPVQNTVTFNGTTATVSSATATQLVVTVPSGATSGAIGVTTPAGSATSTASFTVTGSNGVPTITGFTPSIAVSGTAVSITGTNFDSTAANNKVKFNAVNFATVASATATTLSTSVPPTTGSGHVSVMTAGGTATSSDDFFIPPAPYAAADVQVTGRMSTAAVSKTVTITSSGKVALIVFDGVAGQGLSLQVTGVTVASSTLKVYTPTATQLMSTTVTTSGGTFTFVTQTTGTYTILVAPASGNTGSLTLTFSTPDLVPTALTGPSSASTQQAISVSWTVANQGTGPSGPARFDSLYISPNQVCCSGATWITDLGNTTTIAAGASDSRTQSVTVPNVAAGSYYLILKVDSLNSVYEANESNNQRAIPITVTTPDLVPTALTGPSSASTQQAISVSWTVANQGTGPSGPARFDSLYISPNQVCCSGATWITDLGNTTTIAAGASDSRTQTVTVPNVPAGSYYLILKVDSLNSVYEANESNNQLATAITVTTPDLVPTALTGPASASTQQAISVSWTVANQGTGPSGPARFDSLYISPNQVCCSGATWITDLGNTTTIAAEGSNSRTQTVTVPNLAAGNYYLILKVDSLNSVYEANESNNQLATAIAVTTPDLVPTALTGPASASAQQAISVSWTVANQGTGPSGPARFDTLYISPNQVCCSGATYITDLGNTTTIAAGASDSRTQTVTVPNLAAGNYYLILKVDSLNSVYEANESNNQLATAITVGP
jgi:YD repeat-containing protein